MGVDVNRVMVCVGAVIAIGCGGASEVEDAGSSGSDAGGSTVVDADASSVDAGGASGTDAGASAIDAGDPDAGDVADICPAPDPSGEIVIFGDAFAEGWEAHGAAPGAASQTELVCTGSSAVQYTARNLSGEWLQILTAGLPVSVSRLSMRVHVSQTSPWGVGVYGGTPPSGFPTDWEGVLAEGWNHVEVDIPSTTTEVARIALFRQTSDTVTVTVDDVRLTPR